MLEPTPHLRSATAQVNTLCQGLRALEGRSSLVMTHIQKLEASAEDWKATHPWIAIIFSPAAYRIFTTMVAVEVWEKLSTHLPAHIDIATLRHGHAQYDPKHFVRLERTRAAIRQLYEAQPGPLIAVPVRIERVDPAHLAERELTEGEFDFNLASVLTVLASHTSQWEAEQREVTFAALGEHVGTARQFAAVEAGKATPSFPVAGIRQHERIIAARHGADLKNHFVITGLVR